MRHLGLLLFMASFFSLGCAAQPANPSFRVTSQQADADLTRIAASQKPLDRPLVIIGGFLDPGFAALSMKWRFDAFSTDRRVLSVSVADCFSFDSCRKKVIDAVQNRFPNAALEETVPVDVIGLSLGGVVARYAAMVPTDKLQRRLTIARLFTISSPLRGARDTSFIPALHPMIAPLRPDSEFVKSLNAGGFDYPVYSYVRLGDAPVGEPFAAAPGHLAWWVSTPPFSDPHCGAMFDSRIIADIARRLRQETPWTTEPAAELPQKS